jgi:hypothetical protein
MCIIYRLESLSPLLLYYKFGRCKVPFSSCIHLIRDLLPQQVNLKALWLPHATHISLQNPTNTDQLSTSQIKRKTHTHIHTQTAWTSSASRWMHHHQNFINLCSNAVPLLHTQTLHTLFICFYHKSQPSITIIIIIRIQSHHCHKIRASFA